MEARIVGSSEANPAEGRISYVSPIGKALLGRRAGAAFEKKAEIFGGLILIGIGVKILFEHLR